MPFDDLATLEATTTYATTSALDYGATTNSAIWTGWTHDQVTYTYTQTEGLTCTVAVTNPLVWGAWTGTSTTATGVYDYSITATSNARSWTSWQNQPYSRSSIYQELQEARAYVPPTEEERVAAAAQAELRRQAAAVRTAQRAVAIEKADKLLDSVLNDAQREHLSRHDWFLLKGKNGTIYRIRRGRSANVDVLNKEGAVIARLCAHPAMAVPDGDTMVAQKLMLETEPEEFLRIANRHSVRDVPAVPREIMEELLN